MSSPSALRPTRWRIPRRLLVIAIGLLVVLAALALRPLWLTLFVFPDLVQVGPRPLVWTALSPQRTTLQLPYASSFLCWLEQHWSHPGYLLNNPGMLWCAPGGAQVEGLCLRFNHAV